MPKAKKKDDTNPKDRLGCKKAPLNLLPDVAVIYGAMAFAEGARKYGEYNWRRKRVRIGVYVEAMRRHLVAFNAGEDIDPDSGLPHEAKILACCAILLDARESGCLVDDRFEKNAAARLLARFASGDYHAAAAKLTRTPARTLGEVASDTARAKRRRARARRRAAA